jgi:hypothetical protein
MAEVIASRRTASGATLVQKICAACRHAFWSNHNDHKGQCADCDPAICQDSRGVGRGMDYKRSDRNYHGGNYQG